ncbi:MAG TPA: DUF1761 domain-containing protein [Lacunisphaera sp.]|nr:DUF1761 domain-containing protein [Lacunisphaera sp.]
MNLNYLAVVVTAAVGFLLGWLWYSVLCGKTWMAEMKITEESMKAAAEKGMAKFFAIGFAYTLLGTFGLAALIKAHGSENWLKGAELGLFVGVFIVGMRMLNGSMWEQRSVKLQAINLGHEIALFTLQGAILGLWH